MTISPSEQNQAIEIHDSTLERVNRSDNLIELHFRPAYVHRSEGRPGIDPGTGWVQNALITLHEATMQGELFALPAKLTGGTLEIDEVLRNNESPVPLDAHGLISLKLVELKSGEALNFRCSRLTILMLGDARYVEAFR